MKKIQDLRRAGSLESSNSMGGVQILPQILPTIGRKSKVTILTAPGKCLFKMFTQASHSRIRSQYSTYFNDGEETVKVGLIVFESESQSFPVDAISAAPFCTNCTASLVFVWLEFAFIYQIIKVQKADRQMKKSYILMWQSSQYSPIFKCNKYHA